MNDTKKYFSFHGDGLDLALVFLKNFVFLILTFGIYFPWARTNIRRYLWSNTQFDNDRFSYTGTGKELFLGWMKMLGILFVAGIIISLFSFMMPLSMLAIPKFATSFVYIYMFSIATYSGLKYRALRTLWRQIRFNVDRNKQLTGEFVVLYIKGLFLSIATFGIYLPYFTINKLNFLMNKSNYGGIYFKFDGNGKDYFWICFKGFFITLLTLGLYAPWYFVNRTKYKLSHLKISEAQFEMNIEGKKLLLYAILGYLATLFTMGLASPWVIVEFHKLFASSISLNGAVDFTQVKNFEQTESAMGDEMMHDYDLDIGF